MKDVNDKIEAMVNDAMSRQLRGATPEVTDPVWESIEHYTKDTGKRFRMTKDQKARNISRQEAFQEFLRNGAK